jgi:mRNA interferase RelE/StbE
VRYKLLFSDVAREQLRQLPSDYRRNFGWRLSQLQEDLTGDIKKMNAPKAKYRLRVGPFRVLFYLKEDSILVYAVKNRKEAYE